MNLLRPKCIVVFLIILLIISCFKYHKIKQSFIKGMWYNDDENIYLLISDQKNNGRYGAYLVKDKPTGSSWDSDLDTNELFEMDIKIGLLDGVEIITYKTDKLPKVLACSINLSKGLLKMPLKKKGEITLYKDTCISNSL